ncbi:MAG: TetR/AcrR family transcriptional regulator [Anaerofustis sp.]|jgi:AcrR family transcriptional regulator
MDKKNTKDNIISHAIQLFYETGYEKTTLRKIAEESGYSHVAFRYYYKNKAEIADVLIERYFQGLVKISKETEQSTFIDHHDKLYRILPYWYIHYLMILSDDRFSRFYIEFYKSDNDAFIKSVSKHAYSVYKELYGSDRTYPRNEEIYNFFNVLTNMDITLIRLCYEKRISIQKAIQYLFNMQIFSDLKLNSLSDGDEPFVTLDEIDAFISRYIDDRLVLQYSIYDDFLCQNGK